MDRKGDREPAVGENGQEYLINLPWPHHAMTPSVLSSAAAAKLSATVACARVCVRDRVRAFTQEQSSAI